MIKHYSAGGVVIGTDKKVVVVNQHHDSWSLPKGHIDEGENALEAAKREIHEESGISQVKLIKKLGEYERPRIGKKGEGSSKIEMKHITMYLFQTNLTELKPIDPENPEAIWVDVEQVASLLTHKKDKEFFNRIKTDIYKFLAT